MLRSFKAAGLLSVAAVLLAALTGLAAGTATAAAGGDTVTACESAGTTGMTAKLVVSSPETVSGVVVDAAGCDIGIYVGPGASNAVIEDDTVTGANDHGVLVQDVADVTVRDNRIVHNGVAKKSGLGEDKALTLLGTTGAVVEGNLVSDNAKALRLLGWEPRVALDEGLRRTIAFVDGHRTLRHRGPRRRGPGRRCRRRVPCPGPRGT